MITNGSVLNWRRGRAERPRNVSAVGTAWPATRPAHSFLKFRACSRNVLPSSFRFLDGEYPADPLIAREGRNVLPLYPCHRVRNENSPQIRWHMVYRATGDCFFAHEFHSTSPDALPLPSPASSRSSNASHSERSKPIVVSLSATAVRYNSHRFRWELVGVFSMDWKFVRLIWRPKMQTCCPLGLACQFLQISECRGNQSFDKRWLSWVSLQDCAESILAESGHAPMPGALRTILQGCRRA
jgi:hypothetical protein